MGLFSFFTAPKKLQDIKMALVGKYIFDNIKDMSLRSKIIALANQRIHEGRAVMSSTKTIDSCDERSKYVCLALAMAEMGIDHGLKDFQWTWVKRPFLVQYYDEWLWQCEKDVLKKHYGIDVVL